MFRRPNYVTQEDIQNWNWQAFEKMLAQMAKAWPDIQVILGGINTQNFDPARLGESLPAEFTWLIDRLQREHSEREREAVRRLRDEKDKVIAQQKEEINTLQKRYKDIFQERERLQTRVIECERE